MSIFIIAEIGINHNGDMSICKELIDVAKDAGCDAVKFQKRDIDKVYTQELLGSPRESPWGTTQREQKKVLSLVGKITKRSINIVKVKELNGLLQLGILIVRSFFVNLIASITKLRPLWLLMRNY